MPSSFRGIPVEDCCWPSLQLPTFVLMLEAIETTEVRDDFFVVPNGMRVISGGGAVFVGEFEFVDVELPRPTLLPSCNKERFARHFLIAKTPIFYVNIKRQ